MHDDDLTALVDFYEPGDGAAVARWRTLFDPDAAGPIALVNRFTLRERAAYADGREAGGLEAFRPTQRRASPRSPASAAASSSRAPS